MIDKAPLRSTSERRRELVLAREEERRRIGRDLHDSLGPNLTSVALLSKAFADALRNGEQVEAEDLDEIARLAGESSEQTRALARGLNPVHLQDRSLMSALDQLADDVSTCSHVGCTFEADDVIPDLVDQLRNHLYRIAQEAVNNALKHANAQNITIRLVRRGDSLSLVVEDDGIGISERGKPSLGMGLHIMQDRAEMIGARLRLEEAYQRGTLLRCTIPASAIQRGSTASPVGT